MRTFPNEPPPGRLKGRWKPDVLYMAGDLVEDQWEEEQIDGGFRHFSNYWVALPEPVQTPENLPYQRRQSTNINQPPPRDDSSSQYWERSLWRNITSEITQNFDEYCRLHSINQQTVDNFILSKGIPDWYYFDLLGNYNTRVDIRNVVDLLRTVRGTIYGLKTYLNLINLGITVSRKKPEEYYDLPISGDPPLDEEEEESNYDKFKAFRKEFLETYAFPTPPNDKIEILGRAWIDPPPGVKLEDMNVNRDFKLGDYVYKNEKTQISSVTSAKHYNKDTDYTCSLYRLIDEYIAPNGDITLPSIDAGSIWERIYTYNDITYADDFYRELESLQSDNKNPDNSLYQLDISNLIDDNDLMFGNGITREKDQKIYSCYIGSLLRFLIPAWIRFESTLRLLDIRGVQVNHSSWYNTIFDRIENGFEPYTLTIKPYVGFDPIEWKETGRLNHTEAWEVVVSGDNVVELGAWHIGLDSNLFNKTVNAYWWKEPNGDIKVRSLATTKVDLTARRKEFEDSTTRNTNTAFWRWQLLNWNHYVPHFKVIGYGDTEILWRDLDTDGRYPNRNWGDLETITWDSLDSYDISPEDLIKYFHCHCNPNLEDDAGICCEDRISYGY
jgi:hypothetical protein